MKYGDTNNMNQIPNFEPTPTYNEMELLLPTTIDIGITGKDNRSYKLTLKTINGTTQIAIDPMVITHVGKLDLNDTEYLKFYLTQIVNEFLSRYEDKPARLALQEIRLLVEKTVIANHFDYITFSKQLLEIIDTTLDQ